MKAPTHPPYEQLEEKTVTRMLQEMVKTLDPREATILRARFGLDGGPQKTLEKWGRSSGSPANGYAKSRTLR